MKMELQSLSLKWTETSLEIIGSDISSSEIWSTPLSGLWAMSNCEFIASAQPFCKSEAADGRVGTAWGGHNITQRFQRWNIVTVILYTSYIFLQRVNFLLKTGLANGRHREMPVLLPTFIVLCSSPLKQESQSLLCFNQWKTGKKETFQ